LADGERRAAAEDVTPLYEEAVETQCAAVLELAVPVPVSGTFTLYADWKDSTMECEGRGDYADINPRRQINLSSGNEVLDVTRLGPTTARLGAGNQFICTW